MRYSALQSLINLGRVSGTDQDRCDAGLFEHPVQGLSNV